MSNTLNLLWTEAWRPPDRRPPWLWAEDHIASIPYSPIPGRFRSDNSPWLREPLEALVDPRVRQVSIVAAIQTGKTSVGEIGLCYIIANLPGPALWLSETDDDARDQSESRLQRLFDECGAVRELFPKDRHKRRHHAVHFRHGMSLWILGGHNRTNLQRRSIRWLLSDETWQLPPGHMAEAEARVSAFGWLGKCLWMSQAGEEGDDTDRKFASTDQREWTFACPHCGFRQPWKWDNVEWSKGARDEGGEWDFNEVRRTAVLRCEGCGFHFEDTDRVRRELNLSGRFVPTNAKAPAENVGFHWNALPAMSWGKLAELYLRAKAAARMGDLSLLRQFFQKRLALPWREFIDDFKLEITRSGYRMGDPWAEEGGILPDGRIVDPPFPDGAQIVPLRFLSVDVQLDHFYLVVRGWNAGGSSRLLWCERVTTWEDIESIQARFSIHPNLVFIDANYASFEVYNRCATHGWTALIGDRRATFPHRTKTGASIQRFYSQRHRVVLGRNRSCFVHRWSALNVKDCLARLRRNQDPAKGPTWEVADDAPEEYLAHLESERRVQEGGKWIWKQIGKRPNHFADACGMQVCAALMLKLIGREAMGADPVAGDDGAGPTGDAAEEG